MKIEKKLAWVNQKCNECGDRIYIKKEEENPIYLCSLDNASPEKTWKLCEKCKNKIFGEKNVSN